MADKELIADTHYGYSIEKEAEGEYRISIYCDSMEDAKKVIKQCLEAGIIEWPIQTVGRKKRSPSV